MRKILFIILFIMCSTSIVFAGQYTEAELDLLGDVVYGEARGLDDTQKSAVVWCILNRLDDSRFPDSIEKIIHAKNQFPGYESKKVYKSDEAKALYAHCRYIAEDVLIRYFNEKDGEDNIGRTLPKDYLFYHGDGKQNYFRREYRSKIYWNWTFNSPYGQDNSNAE